MNAVYAFAYFNNLIFPNASTLIFTQNRDVSYVRIPTKFHRNQPMHIREVLLSLHEVKKSFARSLILIENRKLIFHWNR